ncbi:MAG: DUF3782 domain-containing protein [Desulfobacteraceae bacterium]|nr:DUF3782 domain-containing protein [Desulfobacteraceae bacterium]
MLETETLEQIKDYIFEQLPRVLEKDPRFVVLIEGIVAEKFPRRDEFTRLLDELRELRLNTERQFDELRSDMNRRFDQVDKRIDQMDKRIDQMDKRIDQMDTRIDQMDKRIEQIDRRMEEGESRTDRIEHEMKTGFHEVAKQFEQVNKRFEQVDQRFEQVDQRFEHLENEMKSGFHEVHVHIDRLGSRWGIRNEKIFRQTMKSVLEESMGMTVKECFIGGEQFDCIISNGQHILIEIAASVGANIQERLLRKRQLYTDETGISPHRFILAVGSIHSRRAEALRADGFEVIEPEE